MRLESVRSLKEELRSSLQSSSKPKASVSAAIYGASHPAAPGSRARGKGGLPAVALGVVPGTKSDDWQLAVRLQEDTAAARSYAAYIAGKARDEVDIRVVGVIRAPLPLPRQNVPEFRKKVRPLRPGYSVGHYNITAGTIGGFVLDRRGQVCIFSNNHVLADSNRGKRGDHILQPGPADGGRRDRDVVGSLSSYIRLKARGSNQVDVACCTVNESLLDGLAPIYGRRRIKGVRKAEDISKGLTVWKIGRTTGLTRGKVTAIELDAVSVDYGGPVYWFDNQLEIAARRGPFSKGGDSGSIILDGEGLGVGLLFAGSERGGPDGAGLTYANPLEVALEALGVTLYGVD